MKRTALTATLILTLTGTLFAQSWTYHGTEICYDFGAQTQCFAQGTIQGYVTQRNNWAPTIERSYQAGQQLGSGVGALVAVLIQKWMEHRAKVKAETDALEQQLRAYHDAETRLVEEGLTLLSDDAAQIIKLHNLDPARAGVWDAQLRESRSLYEAQAKYLHDLKGAQQSELRQKRKKSLAMFLENYTKPRYERQKQMTANAYVVNEFLKALVGWHMQQRTPERSVKPAEKTSALRSWSVVAA